MMNRFGDLKPRLAFILGLGLAAISPRQQAFAQVTKIPAASSASIRALELVALPEAIAPEAKIPGIEALRGVNQALSRDLAESGGARAPQILQALYGERPSNGGGVSVGASPAAGRGSLPRPGRLSKAKTLDLGVDTSAMDLSVRPQDDFYRYVNGTWLKNFKMPADKARFGAFDEVREKSERTVKAIIEKTSAGRHAAGSDGQQIADLYKSFMNTKVVEAKGIKPIEGDLARIAGVKTKEELVGVFARAMREGVKSPIHLSIDQDSKNISAYIPGLSQSGLGLPDRDYYFNEDASSVKIRAKYVEYLAKLFTLAGEDKATEKAAAVFALEKALAEHHWTQEANRDPVKTYNKIGVDGLGALAPGFNWTAYLREAKVRAEETEVVVSQPSYLAGFVKVLDEQPLETWKLYMKARTLDAASPYLPDAFVQAAFEYKGRTLSGQPKMRPRWKRGVELADGAVGELIGKIYVKENFPASSKAKMESMIENLRAAYAERIQGLAWMGPETKTKALDKLGKFTPKIGYPDKWRDYSKLVVRPDDLLGNVRRSNLHDYDYMIAKQGKPVDRGEWDMTPQTVNAYYNPVMNEIVFPAAILQGVFFNPKADDAVNYGAIGGVIGHEMSHGYDDEGSQFGGDGMLKDWWTPADRAEFEARAGKLVKQFDGYSPLPDKHVNGKLTLGENIGDLGGVTVAYEAYQRSLKGPKAPVIKGFTGDQRFFLGWAQVWRSTIRDKALEQQVRTDHHSPAQYRVNGVMPNVPGFAKAFDLKEGDALFLPEKDRVKIW